MIINIFRMPDGNTLYGDVIEDDHTVGDTFDRFCIYPSGRIEICERTEDKDDIATETETFEVLHTLLEKPSVEHTLSRFYGNRDIVFDWRYESLELLKGETIEPTAESKSKSLDLLAASYTRANSPSSRNMANTRLTLVRNAYNR